MYSAWAQEKRKKITLWLGGIFLIVFGIYIQVSLYTPPSCFDGKLNQDELGIDCGGVCAKICSSQIQPTKTVWARSYKVSNSLWGAFAYLENPNTKAYAPFAQYRFTIYDRSNIPIAVEEGVTFITHEAVVPVYAHRIDLGVREPYRTEFEWVEIPAWYRVGRVYAVVPEEQRISNLNTRPELTAVLSNQEPYPLEDIDVFAILYDVNKNAIATSKTYVDRLSPRGKRNIVFSWNEPFNASVERWEIMTRIPPQEN